jgi:hypothetical protein
MESSEIRIRGHHLFGLFYCFLADNKEMRINYIVILRTFSKDYGRRFAKNNGYILRKLLNDSQVKIKLVAGMDDFCKACPKSKCGGDVGEDKIDKKIIKALGCEVSGVYSLDELIKRGDALVKTYEESLPAKRGRPKTGVAVGSIIAQYL